LDRRHVRSWDAYDLGPNRLHDAVEVEDSFQAYRSEGADHLAGEDHHHRSGDIRLRRPIDHVAAAGTCQAAEKAEDPPLALELADIDRAEDDAAVDDTEAVGDMDCSPLLYHHHVPAAVVDSHPFLLDDDASAADIAVNDFVVGAYLAAAIGCPPPPHLRYRPRRLRIDSAPDSSC
jgi:hypothetical protein